MINRCYPKSSYILFLFLAMAILAACPLFIWANASIATKIVCCTVAIVFAVICLLQGIFYLQYYYFDGDEIVVQSLFGTIVRLNINNVYVRVENLPTYSSRTGDIYITWICIYDKSISPDYRFIKGCSNNKRYKRIQIVYNIQNVEMIDEYIEIKEENKPKS